MREYEESLRPTSERAGMILSDFRFRFPGDKARKCRVPFSLYGVLLRDREIADPVLYPDRIALPAYREIAFHADFIVGEQMLRARHVFLRAHGIDTVCTFLINGRCIGRTRNLYCRYLFEIAPFLQSGKNELTLVFTSPDAARGGEDTAFRRPSYLDGVCPDVGVLGGIEILATDAAIIENVRLRQEHRQGEADLLFDVAVRGDTEGLRAVASLVSPLGRVFFGGLSGDLSDAHGRIAVSAPELWYPNGSGARPLYRFTLTLYRENTPIDRYEAPVGLRDIRLFSSEQKPFWLTVNGIDPFLVGADYAPEDLLLSRHAPARTQKRIEAAASAHISFLRIPAEAGYPDEDFFDFCDQCGILVFQEFAVGRQSSFLTGDGAAIAAEMMHGVARLAAHPSFAALVLPDEGGWAAGLSAWIDRFLPGVPTIGGARLSAALAAGGGDADDPLISFSDEKTWDEMLPPEQRNPFSLALERLQTVSGGIARSFSVLSERYLYPTSFSDAILSVGIAQGEALQKRIEAYRTAPKTARTGVLHLGRLHDTTVSISPSLIDCRGRLKPSYFLARACLYPVCAFLHTEGSEASFTVSCEGKRESRGTLTVSITEDGKRLLREEARSYAVPRGEARFVVCLDLSAEIAAVGRERIVLFFRLAETGGEVFSDMAALARPKEMPRSKKPLVALVSGGGHDFEITLTAPTFLPRLCLFLDGKDAAFSRNCFAAAPKNSPRILCRTEQDMSLDEFRDILRIFSPVPIPVEIK